MYTHIYLRCVCVCVYYACMLCVCDVLRVCPFIILFLQATQETESFRNAGETWDSFFFFFLFLRFLFSKISPRMSSFPCNTPSKSTLHLFSLSTFFLSLSTFFVHFSFPLSYPLAGYYPLNPQAR